MQNRYAGDIGDFGKLGLLRALRSSGLSIGVNWYLTPDERHNGDGRHVEYLERDRFRVCDEPLWTELKRIVRSGRRNVAALERSGVLAAAFYSRELDFRGTSPTERRAIRSEWHGEALDRLAGTDVVFVDPDNGLMVPSAAGTSRANKFVDPQELEDYFRRGSSVVYYQHRARRPDSFYADQHERLLGRSGLEGATGFGLKFRTTSQRYFFLLLQSRHRDIVGRCVEQMLSTEWREHFSVLRGEGSDSAKIHGLRRRGGV